MITQDKQRIKRNGLDTHFIEAETHKSNLILEANLLKAQKQYQQAADKFAKAAQIEEQLSEIVFQKGLMDKYFVHRFSALSCWAQAGNIYQAIIMGEALLAHNDLPDSLRLGIQKHLQILQTRRTRWFAEFAPQSVAT